MALTDAEIEKKVTDLAGDLNKTMQGLQEGIKDGKSALDKVKELDGILATLKDNPDKIKDLTTRVEEVIVKLNGTDFNKQVSKSFRDTMQEGLTESLKDVNFNKQGASATFKMEKAQGELTEIAKAAGTMTGANLVGPNGQPISANPEVRQNVLLGPQRKVHFRSFVETSPMSTDLIMYPQFTGSEGDFEVQVNQGDLKAQLEEKFEMQNAIAYTIAGFYVISKQSIADIPWLLDSILAKGTERYYKAEDRKMFYGSGNNDIKGLKNIIPAFNGEMPNMYEALLNATFALIDTDYDANGIVLRPMNYANLLKYKTTTGEYNSPMLFMPNQQFPMSIAGVPLIMSTAVNMNDSFVGDWSAQNLRMLIREGLNIEFAYQDADNFKRNLVTVRIESRVGLEVDEPDALRSVDLSGVAEVI